MDKSKFDALEVKGKKKGWYLVELYQFKKQDEKDPSYFKDWIEFDGEKWNYSDYEGSCLVCYLYEYEPPEESE